MVSALVRFFPTTRDETKKLTGRFYGARSHRPILKAIHTQMNARGRTPRLDHVLSDNRLQPYIHDGIVTVLHRKRSVRFHVFVKNHCRMEVNKVVQRGNPMVTWRGDILVMRKGLEHEFVNFRGGDAVLADFAVKRFVGCVKQRANFYIPKQLLFRKS